MLEVLLLTPNPNSYICEMHTIHCWMRIFLIPLGLCCFISSPAQIGFQKSFGGASSDYGRSIQLASDGGYLLFGDSAKIGGFYCWAHLIKTDSFGNQLWTRTFGDENNAAQGHGVYQLPNGDILLKISYASAIGINIIKLDANGNTIWDRRYSNSCYINYSGIDMANTDGYVFLGARAQQGTWGAYVLRINEEGDSLWSQNFGEDSVAYAIKTVSNGYVLCGSVIGIADDAFITKMDLQGNRLWKRNFGGNGYDEANNLDATSDGGFIVVGGTSAAYNLPMDLALTKTDSSGNVQWTKSFGGDGYDMGFSVKETAEGGFIILGIYSESASQNEKFYLIKTDEWGNLLWQKTFGGDSGSTGYSMAVSDDGGFALFGYSWMSQSYTDYFFVKTDREGETQFMNDISAETFLIYPNPTSSTITLADNNSTVEDLRIYDIQGRLMKVPITLTGHPFYQMVLDVSDLSNGVYILQAIFKDKAIEKRFEKL